MEIKGDWNVDVDVDSRNIAAFYLFGTIAQLQRNIRYRSGTIETHECLMSSLSQKQKPENILLPSSSHKIWSPEIVCEDTGQDELRML